MSENFTAATSGPCLMAVAVGTVEVRERKLDPLGKGLVRIRTEYSMVSTGTELHRLMQTHTANRPFPCMTGYVALGHIVGVGEGVTKVKLGDRVLFGAAHYKLIDVSADSVRPVPEGVDSRDAVCTSLLSISIRGVRAAKVELGDSVAVFGQGVIGGFATHLAKLSGACPVIAIDPVAARREVAMKMGADVTIDPLKENVPARIKELTGGVGVDAAFEATATPRVVASLPEVTRVEGKIIILGGVHAKVELDLYSFFQKSNQTMIGTGSAYHTDYPYDSDNGNCEAILRMLKAGMIRPRPIVTHCAPYTEGPKIFRMLVDEKDKAIGVQFDWRNA